MRKLKLFGMLAAAAVLALSFTVTGCSDDSDDGDGGDPVYAPLVIPGRIGTRAIQTEITTTRRVTARQAADEIPVLTPQTGDSYVISYVSPPSVISQGSLVVTPTGGGGFTLAFSPAGGGDVFYGTLSGTNALNVPSVPAPGGGTLSASPPLPPGSGGSSSGPAGSGPPAITVTVDPSTWAIAPNTAGTRQFNATVENSPGVTTVTWSLVAALGTTKAAGTDIDSDGLLTIANNQAAGTFTVVATSDEDPTKTGEAEVIVDANAFQGTVTIALGSNGNITATVPNTHNATTGNLVFAWNIAGLAQQPTPATSAVTASTAITNVLSQDDAHLGRAISVTVTSSAQSLGSASNSAASNITYYKIDTARVTAGTNVTNANTFTATPQFAEVGDTVTAAVGGFDTTDAIDVTLSLSGTGGSFTPAATITNRAGGNATYTVNAGNSPGTTGTITITATFRLAVKCADDGDCGGATPPGDGCVGPCTNANQCEFHCACVEDDDDPCDCV